MQEIDRLVNREGYTLKGAVAALKGGEARESSARSATEKPSDDAETAKHLAVGQPLAEDRADLLRKLKGIRADLAEALAN